MSVEIRKTADGTRFECDWGVFENSEADPCCGPHPLMLTTADYADYLIHFGPQPGPRGGVHTATRVGGRRFAHLDYEGKRMTWELFKAHMWDGGAPHDMLIGRWPD